MPHVRIVSERGQGLGAGDEAAPGRRRDERDTGPAASGLREAPTSVRRRRAEDQGRPAPHPSRPAAGPPRSPAHSSASRMPQAQLDIPIRSGEIGPSGCPLKTIDRMPAAVATVAGSLPTSAIAGRTVEPPGQSSGGRPATRPARRARSAERSPTAALPPRAHSQPPLSRMTWMIHSTPHRRAGGSEPASIP